MKIASILYVSDLLRESSEEYEKITKAFPNYGFEHSPSDLDLFRRLLDGKKYNCVVYDDAVRNVHSICEGAEEDLRKLSIMGVETISYLKGLPNGCYGAEVCMIDSYWAGRFEDMGLTPTEEELSRQNEIKEKHIQEFGFAPASGSGADPFATANRLMGIMDAGMPVFMLTWPKIEIRPGNTMTSGLYSLYENAKQCGIIRGYGNTKSAMEFLSRPTVTF